MQLMEVEQYDTPRAENLYFACCKGLWVQQFGVVGEVQEGGRPYVYSRR